jgi:hypothetical protein
VPTCDVMGRPGLVGLKPCEEHLALQDYGSENSRLGVLNSDLRSCNRASGAVIGPTYSASQTALNASDEPGGLLIHRDHGNGKERSGAGNQFPTKLIVATSLTDFPVESVTVSRNM